MKRSSTWTAPYSALARACGSSARLVERNTGRQIWSERYDRMAEDLFAIQDELTATIATTVAARLTMLVQERAQQRPPQDLRAYECFVQGNRYIDRLDS